MVSMLVAVRIHKTSKGYSISDVPPTVKRKLDEYLGKNKSALILLTQVKEHGEKK